MSYTNNDGYELPESLIWHGIKKNLAGIADALAEQRYQNSFLPVLKLADCVRYFKTESERLHLDMHTAGFMLSVTKNYDPRNENDHWVIIQALVDSNNKPIVVNNETISRILHAGTIDSALVKALNGKESKLFRL